MTDPLGFFETLFKPVTDFFYELKNRDVRFRQQRNILTMSGETLLPYQIMKVGDEFYLENTSIEKAERLVSRVSNYLNRQFVAIQDGDLVRIIRAK